MILKILPFLPGLSCVKKIGIPIITTKEIQINSKTGDKIINAKSDVNMSKVLFINVKASTILKSEYYHIALFLDRIFIKGK